MTADVVQQAQFKDAHAQRNGKRSRSSSYDPRGNSKDRNRRADKLVTDPKWKGNGKSVPCVHCGKLVYKNPPKDRPDLKLQQDRINPGGSYAYPNVQPSCPDCNNRRSNDPDWKFS